MSASIDSPQDLKRLSVEELTHVAARMRGELIDSVSRTGGHLGSGLGVVELTIALHYVYDFGVDRLVFDVGHQCYPHKMLTGRAARMGTMRQDGGLVGFPHPDESPYDLFHTGHAGTGISLALGLAVADKKAGRPGRSVALVGDAGYGAGMSFEAMNAASDADVDLLVVLNDNEMSISPTVGSMSRYLTRLRTGPLYTGAKHELHEFIRHIPFVGDKVDRSLTEAAQMLKNVVLPGHVFEEFGFTYFGPMDGHDLPRLVHTLRDLRERRGPVLLHVLTQKGAGCELADGDPNRLHGMKPKPKPGAKAVSVPKADPPRKRPPYTNVFSEALVELARQDPSVIGVTAAMLDGTGLSALRRELPGQCFDVGICEQHAVGFAGGMAKGGLRPVVAIYSTFLQRAYDQVFQELLIQDADVVLALDRAGLVDDGATHHGLFDIAYLRTLPGTVLMAPANAEELPAMLSFAIEHPGTIAVRYPRDAAPAAPGPVEPIRLGRGVLLREGGELALVAYGTMVPLAERVAAILEKEDGLEASVVNARFAKPVDVELVERVAEPARLLVTLEEGSLKGGFGAAVLESLTARGAPLPPHLGIGLPDRFIEHGTRARLLERAGLTPGAVVERIRQGLREGVVAGLPEA